MDPCNQVSDAHNTLRLAATFLFSVALASSFEPSAWLPRLLPPLLRPLSMATRSRVHVALPLNLRACPELRRSNC